ncbi:hypothetical protein QJS10_CPA10g00688 [Acorus calamus]|uniref:Uncharacterized protein n=1 Tax=Acorus calamus TaxID=4465 RepID=A0AAV9DZZ2_ACOCL|nr:hypothetical protein QJS10_CPA10g00688 [Acorus calamus]
MLEKELKQKTVSPVEISGSYPSQEKQPNDEWQISRPRGWLNWISLGMLGVGGTTESSSFVGVVSDEVIKICESWFDKMVVDLV